MSLLSQNTPSKAAGSFLFWRSLFAVPVMIFLALTLLFSPSAVGDFGIPFEFFALISITVPFGSILFQKRVIQVKDRLQVQSLSHLFASYYKTPALLCLLWFCSFLIVCSFLGTFFSLSINLIEMLGVEGVPWRVVGQSKKMPLPLHFTMLIGSVALLTSPPFTHLSFIDKELSLTARQHVWGIGLFTGALLLSVPVLLWFVPYSAFFIVLGTTALFCIFLMGGVLVYLFCAQTICDLSPSRNCSFEASQRSAFSTFLFTGLLIGFVIAVSAGFSILSGEAAFQLGWVGVAFGLQLIPGLIGLRFVPWFTGSAVFCGLVAGLLVVFFTDIPGIVLKDLFFIDLPFSSHPLHIYAGLWGLLFNFLIVLLFSVFTQSRNSFEHRAQLHDLCLERDRGAPSGSGVRLLVWVLCFVWFFFAIGPGAVFGVTVFAKLDFLKDTLSSFTPLFIWCVLWWGIVVAMLRLLCGQLKLN